MKKVYIAGPMTGHSGLNRESFFEASESLKARGFIVLNPAVLPSGLKQSEYMDICLAMIRSCDSIFLLSGWRASKGAVAEFSYADKLGLETIFQ